MSFGESVTFVFDDADSAVVTPKATAKPHNAQRAPKKPRTPPPSGNTSLPDANDASASSAATDAQAAAQVPPSSQTKPIGLNFNPFRRTWSQKQTCATKIVWPTSSAAACWWCCHTFVSIPVSLPIKYCPRMDAFNITGNFCSWSCAKSYANTTRHALQYSELIALMRYKLSGRTMSTKLAPPRHRLALFGGDMSIEDFRAASEFPNRQMMSVHIQQQTFGVQTKLPTPPVDVDGNSCPDTTSGSKQHSTRELSFNNITAKKNEPLKLRRTKPMTKNKTVLEKVLGLTFNPVQST